MRLVIAATGASGSIYLQRLLSQIDTQAHEVHLILSAFARQVVHEELGELQVPEGVHQHGDKSMNVPFASGSTRFDGMAIVPCSMGTLGRIAAELFAHIRHRLPRIVPTRARRPRIEREGGNRAAILA